MVPEIEYRIDRRLLPVRDSGGLWEVLCSSSDLTLMMEAYEGAVKYSENSPVGFKYEFRIVQTIKVSIVIMPT